jgi:hypothetical protein
MSDIETRDGRLAESRVKIVPPFLLDDSMRFYSPQDNLDALEHPRVRPFYEHVRDAYVPDLPPGRHVALLIPCTKTKPYPLSIEHQRINGALLAAGYRPVPGTPETAPDPAWLERLEAGADPEVLRVTPLVRGDAVVHRYVVSEPMGLVPYEFVYRWRGEQSPASSYDDPGLFEHRGTAVSPWRPDNTGTRAADGTWRWGDNEKAAYVDVHNRLTAIMAAEISRLRPMYERIIAWVAPGLTHRSFMMAAAERGPEGVPASRVVAGRRLPFVSVNDLTGGAVEVHPTRREADGALDRLQAHLERDDPATTRKSAQAVYARGGGGATPLALQEMLEVLTGLLDR